MRSLVCVLALVSFVDRSLAGALPPFIEPCSASDSHLNQCIERVIQTAIPQFTRGIPELGIAPLDPVELGTIPVTNPALKLTFFDTVVTGLGGSRLNSYKINLNKGKAVLDFTANVTLKARYEMDGKVLILPIRGNGDAKIKITNLNIIVKYDFVTKNGHWEVPSYTDSYKMDRAQFKFTNLFNGNKELAETTSKFLNESWSIVMAEVAPPAIKEIIKQCVSKVVVFFSKVPADQLLAP